MTFLPREVELRCECPRSRPEKAGSSFSRESSVPLERIRRSDTRHDLEPSSERYEVLVKVQLTIVTIFSNSSVFPSTLAAN
jgi:hypothetical protein